LLRVMHLIQHLLLFLSVSAIIILWCYMLQILLRVSRSRFERVCNWNITKIFNYYISPIIQTTMCINTLQEAIKEQNPDIIWTKHCRFHFLAFIRLILKPLTFRHLIQVLYKSCSTKINLIISYVINIQFSMAMPYTFLNCMSNNWQ